MYYVKNISLITVSLLSIILSSSIYSMDAKSSTIAPAPSKAPGETCSRAQIDLYSALTKKINAPWEIAGIVRGINAAIDHGADPNKITPIIDPATRQVIRQAPPLAYCTDIRPEFIKALIARGADVNSQVFILQTNQQAPLRKCSLARFFVEHFFQNNIVNDPRATAKTCVILETLFENGAQGKDELIAWLRHASPTIAEIGIGVIYHMLMAPTDRFSAFIDSINKFHSKGISHFGTPEIVNQYDIFGFSPLAYAIQPVWSVSRTPLDALEKLGVNKYQSLTKHQRIIPVFNYNPKARGGDITYFTGKACPICLNEMEDNYVLTRTAPFLFDCGHAICMSCRSTYDHCPLCRK
jgi:hypothetical protein